MKLQTGWTLFLSYLDVLRRSTAEPDLSSFLLTISVVLTALIFLMSIVVVILLAWRIRNKKYQESRHQYYLREVASALLRFLDTDKLLGLPKLRRKDKKILRNILLSLIHAMLGKEREFFVLLYRHYGFVDADIRQCTSLTWGKRLRALKRLDELEEPSLESLFYNLASDSHPLVALSALESLSKISQQINPKRLMPILKNRTKDHKFAAIEIVLNLVRCQGIESLLNVLEEEVLDEYTLGLGIEALGVLRRIESLPTLLKLAEMNLSAENKFRLLRAIRGLGKLDNLSFYSNHLRDQNPKVRAEALKGLKASGKIPETDLVYALSDESVEVRRLVSTISSTEDRGTM